MASPVQQIPVSAGFQVSEEKEKLTEIDRGESIQNHKDEDAQESKLVNTVFYSQGEQDTAQSQTQVPQVEKSSKLKGQSDIERGESIQDYIDQGSQVKTVVDNVFSPQADQTLSQSQAHVPQDEKTSEPKDQEAQVGDESKAPPKGTSSVIFASHVEPQSSNPHQEATFSLTATVSKVCTVSSDGSQGGAYMVSGDPLSLSPTVSNFYFNKAVELPTRSTTRATKVITDPCKGSHVGTYTAVADVKLERSVAFPPTEVQEVEAVFLGVNMVSQLTFSRGGVALTVETSHTAVVSTFNAAMTTKATADDPGKGSQGGTCTAEQKQCHSKAVVLSTLTLNAVLTTSKATADDQCKGSQGGTCTFGADVRGYQYISVWVAQHPPPNTGGAAPAWPPPLRLSNTREAARRNSISTAVRAQIKAVPRLG
jgi:hypothetical protein